MATQVVDAHQHFWDVDRYSYYWMSPPALEPMRRTFLPEDLKPLLRDVGVHRTVIVQAQASLDETHWFLELAEANEFIAGVVGWVDLTAADLPEVLDELVQHPKFKGARHQVEDEPDDAWLNRSDVLGGLAELAKREIPYRRQAETLGMHPRHGEARARTPHGH